MNLIKPFVIAIFPCVFSVSIQAQNVKPKFKKLIFIGYYAGALQERGPHIIDYTIEFNETDTVHYTANNFVVKTHVYGMSDTAYKVADTLIRELNKIFNGKKALKAHMITNKLKNGDSAYAGHIYFIKYVANDNTTDSFIAVQPFLDKELSGLIDKITSMSRGSLLIKRKIYHDVALENMVLDLQKTCNYIPKPEPPKVSQLEIAPSPAHH